MNIDIKYFVENIVPLATPLAAMVAGIPAAYTYYKNGKLRRAEWLYSLFEKFYYEDKYAEIRKILDYEREIDIIELKSAIIDKKNNDLEEKLVNYLNFFEFISNLWILKQIPISEIKMMFDYYIRRLHDHDFIMSYITSNGFEGLNKLILEIKKS